ncbi:MAG: hypothetical protein WCP55_07275 [Lentisphaerota bacterium]
MRKNGKPGNVKSAAPNGAIYERKLIVAGLAKLGIDGDYEIVTGDEPGIVERTAAETLWGFLWKGGLNLRIVPESKLAGEKRFLLGRDANPRGVLYGVFAVSCQNWLECGRVTTVRALRKGRYLIFSLARERRLIN